MTTEEKNMLVFKDHTGEYYLLPQAMLQQGRVPEEHKAEVDRRLAESNDVSGYRFTRTGDLSQVIGAGIGTWIIWDRRSTPIAGWDFNQPDGGTTPPGSPHP